MGVLLTGWKGKQTIMMTFGNQHQHPDTKCPEGAYEAIKTGGNCIQYIIYGIQKRNIALE